MTVETSDLYYAAFLLAKGNALAGCRWSERGRATWEFTMPSTCRDAQVPYLEFLRGELVSGRAMALALVDLKKMAMNPPIPSTSR